MHPQKKAFSVVPKASLWRPNHVTTDICLPSTSLWGVAAKWPTWAPKTKLILCPRDPQGYSRISLSLSGRILKEYWNIVSASKQTPCGIPWDLRNRTHWSTPLQERAWCGAARKSARLNCINLIHFRLRVDCAGARALLYMGSSANCYSSRRHSRPA